MSGLTAQVSSGSTQRMGIPGSHIEPQEGSPEYGARIYKKRCTEIRSVDSSLCGTGHDARRPNSTETPASAITAGSVFHRALLSDMPNEIMTQWISFTPDSVRALRAVSHGYSRAGEDFLLFRAERIITICSDRDSALYSFLFKKCVYFGVRYWSEVAHFDMQFHLSIPQGIRALGVPCPDKILSCLEISLFNCEVQKIQDSSLEKVWEKVRCEVMLENSALGGVPQVGTSAANIRTWMHANPTVLQTVQELSLKWLGVACVPVEVDLLTQLKGLDLSDNPLVSLPEDLFQGMIWLQRLYLGGNRLSSLPENLFQGMASLEVLDLSSNGLHLIPANAFQGLTCLQRLNLEHNFLTSLPENLFQELAGLQKLHLAHNLLASLPENLFQGLNRLEELYLGNNVLYSLPGDIFHGLTGLQYLDFSKNQVSFLPENLFQGLGQLRELHLSSDRLNRIPRALFQGLNGLQWINYYGFRIDFFPDCRFHGKEGEQALYV